LKGQITQRVESFESFGSQLYSVNDITFEDIALRMFRYQAIHNPVYQSFLQHLHIPVDKIHSLAAIPFLPISFFKNQIVKSGSWKAETVFSSSGTTGTVTSSHHIRNLRFYQLHATRCFEHFFGKVSDYNFLALLPSYLERKNSSLVAMLDHFIKESHSVHSGFYLNNISQLLKDLENLKTSPKKTILWGVTFALMDLAENHRPDLSHCLVFETGGMKGQRKEIIRTELHNVLKAGFNVPVIHSEYGMTELLSQSYTTGQDRFFSPPWQKMIGRDLSDPFFKGLQNETAGINVIDLANWHSIAFIETEDLGKINPDHSFEILGRMDNSDVRGCNLMV
jgi:hypothetical protein